MEIKRKYKGKRSPAVIYKSRVIVPKEFLTERINIKKQDKINIKDIVLNMRNLHDIFESHIN